MYKRGFGVDKYGDEGRVEEHLGGTGLRQRNITERLGWLNLLWKEKIGVTYPYDC